MRKHYFFQLLLCVVIWFFIPITIEAQIVTKETDDGSDGTLRHEIADTPAGGEITFAEGITNIALMSELMIEKELTITADSTSRVTVDAQTQSRIFNITAGPVTFNYLNLINGFTHDNGGAIQALNTDLTFNYTDINSCYAGDTGGAVYTSGAENLRVNHGTIQGNIGYELGGGFYIKVQNTVFENVIVDGNGSDNGSGGIFSFGGDILISGCTISNNQFAFNTDVFNDGAGIANSQGNLKIVNSIIKNNLTRNIGGGILSSGGTLEITDSEISSNYAQDQGCGIAIISNSLVTFNNVNIINNVDETSDLPFGRSDGGAIYAYGNDQIIINGGVIEDNSASQNGGGIYFNGGILTINGTRIAGNDSNSAFSEGGGGIYANEGNLIINAGTQFIKNFGSGLLIVDDAILQINSSLENPVIFQENSGYYGAAIAYRSLLPLDLNNVSFENNSAVYGGALHSNTSTTININRCQFSNNGQGNNNAEEGGAIWNGPGTINLDGATFSRNNANERGGGIYNNGGTININNSEIKGGTSYNDDGAGGGIYNDNGGSLSITHSTFSHNSVVAKGGAIFDNSTAVQGTIMLTDVILKDNFANGSSGNGGALYFMGNGNVMLNSVEISGNNADNQAGAIWNDAANINIRTSTISGNSTADFLIDETNDGNGGGIYNNTGNIYIDASTLVLNKSLGKGGAIYNASSTATATLKNSIVALNTSEGEGNNLAGENGFVSADYNLIGEDSLNVFLAMSNDLVGTSESPLDPMIDSLADNGGFTRTHALLEGSPAYNAGNPIDNFPDQRGEPVFGGRRDIGAFEAQSSLGIDDVSSFALSESVLYPNPSTGSIVNLNIPNGASAEIRISVIEIGSGKVVLRQKGRTGVNQLDIGALAKGAYVVKMVTGSTVESLKMIVGR